MNFNHNDRTFYNETGTWGNSLGVQFDKDFVYFCFRRLADAGEMENALKEVAEQIALRFDLTSLAVLEHDRERKCLVTVACWQRDMESWPEAFSGGSYEGWNKMMTEPGNQGMVCISDAAGEEIPQQWGELLRSRKIRAMVGVAFDPGWQRSEGAILGCDREKARDWTAYEANTMGELARVLGFFVRLGRRERAAQERIRILSTRDPLTGLYNLEAFQRDAQSMMGGVGPEQHDALLSLEIGGFSEMNETFGHEAGDEILVKCARILEGNLCGPVCRVYSALFLGLCAAGQKEELLSIIRRIQEEFTLMVKKTCPASDCVLSIGIYQIEGQDCQVAQAIDNADLARKSIRGDREQQFAFYSKRLSDAKEEEQRIIRRVHAAMEAEELELFLHPRFLLGAGQVAGAEALARWRNDNGSLKGPDEFIPILERVGYVADLDFYILEQALQSIRRWQGERRKVVPISVNFSRNHNDAVDFSEKIRILCKKYGVSPSLIEIEITEGSIAEGGDRLREQLRRLREAGFAIVLDDFGTGRSSLNILLTAPVDVVKIGRSFFREAVHLADGNEYLTQLGRLLRAAGKEVVFTGVETQEQAQLLLECGYSAVQGYLFGRPMAVGEFEKHYT